MFWGTKNKNLNFFWKYCSVRTEKLHKIKLYFFSKFNYLIWTGIITTKFSLRITSLITFGCWANLSEAHLKGWQNSRGHKRWIFVDKMGEFLWKLLVNSHGQKCPREFLFWSEFLWTFFWWFFWTFSVNYRAHFFNN